MSRIVILGNSHVAALRAAANAQPGHFPKDKVAFFAAPARVFSKLSLDPKSQKFGCFDKKDSWRLDLVRQINGDRAIQLRDDDKVMFYGENSPLHKFIELIDGRQIDKFRQTEDRLRVSRLAFSAFLDELVTQIVNHSYASKSLDRPCHYMLAPRLPDAIRQDAKTAIISAAWARAANHPEGLKLAVQLFQRRLKEAFVKKGVTFLKQHPATLAASGLTHRRFLESSETLGEGYENDYRHMNAVYGRITLDHILKQMG